MCDVSSDEQIAKLFDELNTQYGVLHGLVHSVAFAPAEELKGEFVNTTREGFRIAHDISVYSLIAVSRAAAPLMTAGGSIVTLTYYGAEKVVPMYNVMGVAKAALEASVRYLANDLGPRGIRVNAISAGPVRTLAGSGIGDARACVDADDLMLEPDRDRPISASCHALVIGRGGAGLNPVAGHLLTATSSSSVRPLART